MLMSMLGINGGPAAPAPPPAPAPAAAPAAAPMSIDDIEAKMSGVSIPSSKMSGVSGPKGQPAPRGAGAGAVPTRILTNPKVRPDTYCLPHHPTHFGPHFLSSNAC
jgi:hypothetical protein